MDLLLTLTMDRLIYRSLSTGVRLYLFIFLVALFIGIQWRSVVLNNMYGSSKRIRDASIYTSKKISLKFLFLSDIFLFPFVRQ